LELPTKVQATVLLSFQAKTFEEAGALLDDVLARARERAWTSAGSTWRVRRAIGS